MFRTTLAVAVALASAGVIAPAVGHAADNTTQPAAEPEYTGRIVVRYEKGTDAAERDDLEEHAAREHGVDLEQAPAVDAHTDVLDAADPDKVEAVADEIAADPAVVSAEPAIRFRPTAVTPNDPYFPQQWNLGPNPGANVQAAWPTSTGAGQTVAVIDSGITSHPDLTGRLVSGYDFISDTNYSNDGTGPDADPSDPGDWTTSGECGVNSPSAQSSWHGTHVAGIVAATAENGVGVAGAAFGAKVQPIRALGTCGGTSDDAAKAILWASGASVTGTPINATPSSVINLSFGGSAPSCPSYLQSAIDTATSRGSLVVVSAGNSDVDAASFAPANCSNVVVVGASNKANTKASYSNYGSRVTLSAPGGDSGSASMILSTWNTGTTGPSSAAYGYMAGTSQAAPHVAAAAAIVKAVDPSPERGAGP